MPVDFGLPPVIKAVPPGSESDGFDVAALVYSAPERVSLARAELGWLATYQSRSLWCIPSTDIRRTWSVLLPPGLVAPAPAGMTTSMPNAAADIAASPTTVGRLTFNMMLPSKGRVGGRRCPT